MNDFAFVGIMLAFFALASLFVAGCDRIIGSEEEAFAAAPSDAESAPISSSGMPA
jgi:hypothetical protein